MNCTFCGKQVPNGAQNCPVCGADINWPSVPQPGQNMQTNYQSSQNSNYRNMNGQYNAQSVYQNQNNLNGYQQNNQIVSDGYEIKNDTGMIKIFKYGLKNYANFKGRARRREYWMFTLCNGIIGFVLGFISGIFSGIVEASFSDWVYIIATGFTTLSTIYTLAVLVPSLAVTWRRLHDAGKKGTYYFMSLIPLVGPILVLVAECQDSQQGANQYGPYTK